MARLGSLRTFERVHVKLYSFYVDVLSSFILHDSQHLPLSHQWYCWCRPLMYYATPLSFYVYKST